MTYLKCPHCDTAINLQVETTTTWEAKDYEESHMGYNVSCGHCPQCQEFIVLLNRGSSFTGIAIEELKDETVLYPKFPARKIEPEVPDRYRKDFSEACSVLQVSPKASAALSRRILQDVLIEKFEIKHRSLDKQIDEFISGKDIPSYLVQAIDAIRHIGNFAAHPLKDTNTGEIVEVESGEAEWLLEVLESLFDFAFVQPIRLGKKKSALNQKLQSMGKPPMKG
jgi:hypothetical protein